MAETVLQVLDAAAEAWGRRPAMRVKRGERWRTITWNEYRRQARQVARGLMALGLEPGGAITIIGFNRPEWFLADVGAIYAGGVAAGIYTTCSPRQCQYITGHCEARVAIVEDPAQLAKFKQVRDELPKLAAIVMMDGDDPDDDVYSWDELLERGTAVSEAALDARVREQHPDDLATLIYTSGTTGPPKAVMLSHANLTWTATAVLRQFERYHLGSTDCIVSYLPLSHIAEQIVSLHAPMSFGGCVWFAESLETLGDTLREARPTVFFGVPRVWEKIQAKIVTAAAQHPGWQKKVIAWARDVGLAGGYAEQQGERKPLTYAAADKLVFSKVRERLGFDRCRLAISSAAPISMDTLEFFLGLGVPIYEVYGMSECTGPTTISVPHRYRTGKAGFAIPGTELRIADDGEICMRGPHVFMGYLKDEPATRTTVDEDGWLYSGDIGQLDADGFLSVTDRKKDLIITAGGKNIAPQVIEALLTTIPEVGQAVVVGDRRKFLSALLTLDPQQVEAGANAAGIGDVREATTVAKSDAFARYLQERIDQINTQLSRTEHIKKFVVLPSELTIDAGELTPTMKLKRRVIHDKYASQIESMYA